MLNKDEDIYGNVRKRWPEAEVSVRDMVSGRKETEYDELEVRSRDNSKRQSCIQAHVRVIFNQSGEAYPCCPDVGEQLKLGDIRTQSLKEIFTSELARNLRRDLNSKKAFDSDPCRNCSSFETYKGYRHTFHS